MQDTTALDVRHDPARRRRQQLALAGCLALGALVLAVGVASVVAGVVAGEPIAVALAVGFGLLLALVGCVIVVTAVELLVRIRRALGTPVLRVDGAGIHAPGRASVPWDAIAALRLRHARPAARGPLTARPVAAMTERALDEHVGRGLGLRDGHRVLHATRRGGAQEAWDLTLWVAPAEQDGIAERLHALAAARGVPFEG